MYRIKHSELGEIVVKPNVRAKKVIARPMSGHIELTIPQGLSHDKILESLDRLKPQLLKLPRRAEHFISETTSFQTFTFEACIKKHEISNQFRMTLRNGMLTVFVPENVDILSLRSQNIIKNLIEEALRHEAKRVLPVKTEQLAQKFKLTYRRVFIKKLKSKWGSCSSDKNINLSLYLMLLDEKMIEYVILHELTHTLELNHSTKFWEKLSVFCGEDAKMLDKKLRYNLPNSYAYFFEH
ncbi:MAG: hypothetical protein PWQ65_832 [Bacteroidota bacterium]|nr:hypothetical protein [Bacteroidota bacterium]